MNTDQERSREEKNLTYFRIVRAWHSIATFYLSRMQSWRPDLAPRVRIHSNRWLWIDLRFCRFGTPIATSIQSIENVKKRHYRGFLEMFENQCVAKVWISGMGKDTTFGFSLKVVNKIASKCCISFFLKLRYLVAKNRVGT